VVRILMDKLSISLIESCSLICLGDFNRKFKEHMILSWMIGKT